MTPRERVLAFLEGKEVDKIPNFSIVMQILGRYSNTPYDECIQNYKLFCDANYRFCNEFGIDLLCAISDPMREASAFGAQVSFPKDAVPHSAVPLLAEFEDWKTLVHFNSLEKERTLDRINAVRYFKENYTDYIVAGWVEGPFAEACDLRDINNFMVDVLTEEADDVHEFLTFICDQQIEFALKQIDAGADIIGIGDAATSLISSDTFNEFALPYQIKLIDAIHNAGAKTKLHICGDITHHLEMLAKTNTDILDVDYPVDLKKACDIFAETKTILSGNFNPTQTLLEGTKEGVIDTIIKCNDITGGKHIIAPGCEVPRNTPYENMLAVAEAIAGLGK